MLYRRKVELFVDSLKFVSDKFDIYFDIPFDEDEDVNIAKITIFNLSNETINQFKQGSSIILNAGYEGDVGAIFLGVCQFVKTENKGVDKETIIHCIDASDSWLSLDLNKTYKAGIKASYIVKDLINTIGVDIGELTLPNDIVYSRGKTVKGKVFESITSIAKSCGAKAHVTKKKVYIREPKKGDDIGFILNSDRGLIGSPTHFEHDDIQGFEVLSLLNHRIITDSVLKIESKTANGKYRVRKGRHIGNDSEFYTEMEVIE